MMNKRFQILLNLFLFFLTFQNIKADEYLWAGANQYQLWFQRFGRIQMQLNEMQEAELKVLRIFLGHRDSYLSWEDPPEAYSFENPIGTYNDVNLEKVDYLMSECLKRNIKLIVALSTHSKPYIRKYGSVEIYRSTESVDDHKNRFNYFLNHYNSYLGKTWKDCDKVVYAWEIQNEPGIPLLDVSYLTSTQRHDIIRNFLNELSTYLKTIDPNTKVALGIAGYANYYHNGKSGDDIRTLGNIEDADIYTFHFYGGDVSQWIDDNLPYCRSINKLLFLEEFGGERKIGMADLKNLYQSITQTCRNKGVPWMFWRLGHRKDGNTWSINSEDEVWQDVIVSEASLINQTTTEDEWGINPISSVNIDSYKNNSFDLLAYYPNPFNTSIKFEINFPSAIDIRIYNIDGKMVYKERKIFNGSAHNFIWNGIDRQGKNIISGVYFVNIRGKNNLVATKKISLIK